MLRNDDECGVVTLERGWKIALLAFRVRHAEQGDVEDGLQFPKHPLTQIELHPFDTVAWITAPIDIKDESGKVIFADNVEFPDTWGERDKQVVASKYFFGDHGQGFRETSLKQMVARVSYSIGLWALDNGTFRSPADAENFLNYLMMIQIHQEFAFNSPVYFNVGVHCYGLEPSPENYIWDEESQGVIPCPDANKYPQISACFIQSVEDNMQSIMKLATSEAMLFKRGSGTGTDLSTLRSSKERLSCGGTASGPVSFMAVFDRIAAIVKSGGRTRRAAKMQTIKYWHPDIWEFVECKPRMERMARTLIRNGYEANFNGEVYSTVLFQNANLSVRVDDYFMSAARDGGTFDTRAVTTGDIVATYPAEKLLDAIAFGSHDCGDPALQFEDTIQRWHTVPNHGPINSSNPCARRGSRLLTAGGWMKVEDLSELESVDIFDGVGFVSGKVWLTGRKGLVRLHMNSGETLDLTPDHRVYTTEGWKSAESCVDSVVPRVLPNIPSTGDTQLPRAITGASGKFYSACDVLLMEALGFLQGDGSLREGIATLHYTPEKDLEYIESSIVPVLSDIAADKGETHYYPHSDGHKFVFSRRRLTEWLQAIGFVFRPLPERILPGLIWGAKRNAQAAFLRGLFGANGNVLRDARNAIVLVSTCRQMLSEVQLILRTLGIMSSVRIHSKAQDVEWDNGVYVSKESYHLEITHQQDISVFARQVGFPQSSQQSKLMEAVRMERADSRDGGPSKRAFMKVVKVENISEEDDVYDFRTPTTAMGLCNGVIIHNCSEYMHIDDSACNLASVNLLRFYGASGRARPGWNRDHLFNTCRVAATSMETMVGRASYPTPEIALNSHRFRPLGGGYCNLGALVMVRGLPYDSPGARLLGAALASLITGAFYLTSADLARRFGAFDGYAANADAMIRVIDMHRQNFMDQCYEDNYISGITSDDRDLFNSIDRIWREAIIAGRSWGYRNSQSTCIAPTGTIGFMMGCDTLSIEPETALVRYKHLAGGGVLKLVNTCIKESLCGLGYDNYGIEHVTKHMETFGTIEDITWDGPEPRLNQASGLKREHLPVFDCAFPPAPGEVDGRKFRPREGRSIAPAGHVRMMGQATGCVSGAISKTVNMPASSTVEDIKKIYFDAWQSGCKSISVYRDGSKGDQPVSTSAPVGSRPIPASAPATPARFRMPDDRPATIHKFNIMGHEGFITVGFTADGQPGEVFISVAKQGSTVGGLMGVIGTLISLLLQHYVPMSKVVEKLSGQNFEPRGITKNINIRFCKSIVDYLGQYLGSHFVPGFQAGKNPLRADGATSAASSGPDALEESLPTPLAGYAANLNGSICPSCGEIMVRVNVNCEVCSCGHSEGGCGG